CRSRRRAGRVRLPALPARHHPPGDDRQTAGRHADRVHGSLFVSASRPRRRDLDHERGVAVAVRRADAGGRAGRDSRRRAGRPARGDAVGTYGAIRRAVRRNRYGRVMKLIDNHVHGAVTRELDFAGFESQLAEGHGVQMFDTQLGFAIRRWCAPVLDLLPSAPPEEYVRRRLELGVDEVNRRFLTASDVDAWLVDTGFKTSDLTTPDEMAAVSGRPAMTIVRLEAVAEQVARDVTAAGFADAFGAALAVETAATGAVGYKSVVAYRYGFDFDPARPGAAEVAEAAGRMLRAIEAGGRIE